MIFFVIPVYRPAESLPELHRHITAVFGNDDHDPEIVFDEDYSCDDSWSVTTKLNKSFTESLQHLRPMIWRYYLAG